MFGSVRSVVLLRKTHLSYRTYFRGLFLSLYIYISLSVLCFANYDINMFFVAVDCCIKIWIKIAYKRLFYPIHTSIENWAGVKRVTKTAIGNKCLNLSLLNLYLQRVLLPFMIKLNQTTVFSFSY